MVERESFGGPDRVLIRGTTEKQKRVRVIKIERERGQRSLFTLVIFGAERLTIVDYKDSDSCPRGSYRVCTLVVEFVRTAHVLAREAQAHMINQI